MVGWLWARRQRRREQREYSEKTVQRREQLAVLVTAERARRTAQAPDAVQVLLTAQRPGRQLWERRPTHEDFLEVRIGLADQPSGITVRDPDSDQPPQVVTEAPVTVNLATVGTVGLTGPQPQTKALARWMVAQAAVQSGPADLSIVVLARPGDREAGQTWDWMRWLPHAGPGTGPAGIGRV
jgi:DNA segregation ATPase FtsK/SpoIIIE, S-DNA-T family